MRRARLRQVVDGFCFVFAGLAAVWLAILVVSDTWRLGWWGVPGLVVFWALLAYLVLPRLHRILTDVYVPDYFIGRTRTSDGLLGDPVNLALLGEEVVLHDVMTRSGWTRADDVSLRSSWGIVVSTLTRRSYPEAPVSPLFLFGKQQDFAYQQEVDGNAAKRHHVRFWRCPPGWLLPGGTRVDWLAAGTFDRAVGLSLFTLQVTHKIEADIDVERDHIVASVLAGAPEVSVHVLEDFSTGYHSRNGGGDSVHTDGDLPVIALPGPDGGPPAPAPVTSRVVELTAVGPREAASLDDDDRKRGAYELPDVEDDTAPLERISRPASIVLGVVTTFARAVAVGAVVGGLAILGPERIDALLREAGTGSFEIEPVGFRILLVIGALVAVTPAAVGLMVLRGVDWARLTVLLLGCLSILVQFVAWWGGHAQIVAGVALAVTALDILTLLALSGKPARQFSRQRRPRAPTTLGT
ncbi:LssY C-terminal domain-containing protein [Serinibacter arcticus]|uniref:LssY C-terminal domain-containing protein n=1 Tax=Serinibacter arcticus TaxID=1655435 RepID=UPI001F42A954|nr:LssY C-terminal domain-containing protein [Serinibacter arcticus]